MLRKDQYIQGMWAVFSCEGFKAKKFREEAEKEKQEEIQDQWQREYPAKEYLEQVKCCQDTDCTPRMMKQAFFALKGGDGEEYKSILRTKVKATERAFHRIKEAFEKVAKDEAGKLRIVQEIKIKCTDYLRRMIAPAEEQGGITMSYLCPHCNSFQMEDYVWWVSGGKKHTNWWCARSVEKIKTGGNQTGSWWCKQAKVSVRLRSSMRMRCRKVCART